MYNIILISNSKFQIIKINKNKNKNKKRSENK